MPTETAVAATGYDAFAPFYDAFTAASDYEAWTDHVLDWPASTGSPVRRCWTWPAGPARASCRSCGAAFEVTACDVSAGMLAAGGAQGPGGHARARGRPQLPKLGSFDLVTCFDDSLNYLPEEHDLGGRPRFDRRQPQPARAGRCSTSTRCSPTARRSRVDSVSSRDGLVFAWRGECAGDAEPGCRAAAPDRRLRRARGRHVRARRPPSTHSATSRASGSRALLGRAGLECARRPRRARRRCARRRGRRDCGTSRSCTWRGSRKEVTTSEHQEDGEAGAAGAVGHEDLVGAAARPGVRAGPSRAIRPERSCLPWTDRASSAPSTPSSRRPATSTSCGRAPTPISSSSSPTAPRARLLEALDGTRSVDQLERDFGARAGALCAGRPDRGRAARGRRRRRAHRAPRPRSLRPPAALLQRSRARRRRRASEYQRRAAKARVAMLGLGGLGSWAAYALACCGVGELVLVDGDRVEESNFNRQILYREHDVGRLKTEAAAEALAAFDSACRADRGAAPARGRGRGARGVRGRRLRRERGRLARARHRALGQRGVLRRRQSRSSR